MGNKLNDVLRHHVTGDVGSVANAVRSLQNGLADLVKVEG